MAASSGHYSYKRLATLHVSVGHRRSIIFISHLLIFHLIMKLQTTLIIFSGVLAAGAPLKAQNEVSDNRFPA